MCVCVCVCGSDVCRVWLSDIADSGCVSKFGVDTSSTSGLTDNTFSTSVSSDIRLALIPEVN